MPINTKSKKTIKPIKPKQPLKARNTKKASLHPRNPHQGRYNFDALIERYPLLERYLQSNPKGDQTINFSNDKAVLFLNKALLAHYYNIKSWKIPTGYMCPPIPGRADYIHYLADLLTRNRKKIPMGPQIKVLDIGTGSNCIYPIIGSQSYGWHFVATDIDPTSIESANAIVQANPCLTNHVTVVQQTERQAILKGIINSKFDLTLCNPPFHASMSEAKAVNKRKLKNLSKDKKSVSHAKRNFGGKQVELCCRGGEIAFLKKMARESVEFAEQVCWFTSLVSKGDNIRPLKRLLEQLGAKQIEVVPMSQGQKISRFIAWSFLTKKQQASWARERWSS
jgi:23S rRNA (adenine1618-N6)-methyltransferase